MKAYQFKITLEDIHPPIWRRFTVPSALSFNQFTLVLNTVMGWESYHLSSYTFNQLHIDLIDEPDADDAQFSPNETLDAAEYLLEEFVEKVRSFRYVYDFGDYWSHRIELEKIIEDSPDDHPVLLKYKGACPWEDCGGPNGYQHTLDVLNDPGHKEYKELREWTGGSLPPYDPEEVNDTLSEMRLLRSKTRPVHMEQLCDDRCAGKAFRQVVPSMDREEKRYALNNGCFDEDPEELEHDKALVEKVENALSDPEVREQVIEMIAIGIYVDVIDLLVKNSSLSEQEICRCLELDEDMINAVNMVRQTFRESEQPKQKGRKKKNG